MVTKNSRILAFLLVVFMIVGMLSSLSVLPSFADEDEGVAVGDEGDGAEEVTVDEDGDTSGDEEPEEEEKPLTLTIEEAIQAYLTKVYESKEEKLADMKLRLTRGDYEMYVEEATGEVAVRNSKTGQIILSNPYDVYKVSSDNVKSEILSQVVVSFRDITNNNQTRTMYSYSESAQRGQITIKNIKNGIRAEYILGKQSAKKLMPYWMEASRFEKLIVQVIEAEGTEAESDYLRFMSYYTLKDPNDAELPQAVVDQMKIDYPCTGTKYYTASESITFINKLNQEETRVYNPDDRMAIYVIDETSAVSERATNYLEGIVKQYCPEYNFEELDYDIELTGYTGDDAAAAIFTVAVEWYLENDGFYYSVPTNSITYDEDTYQLDYFAINTYLGCTNVSRDGYVFYPDGSGTLIYNNDIGGDSASYTIASDMYGPDFSYHTVFYTGKSETITMPVFGVIDDTEYVYNGELIEADAPVWEPLLDEYGDKIYNEDGTIEYAVDEETGEKIPVYKTADEDEVTKIEADAEAGVVESYYLTADPDQVIILEENVYYFVDEDGAKIQDTADLYEQFVYTVPQGYIAIIEDGESLARITYSYGGISHKYCTVYSTLRPVQSDSYNLAEAISVGSNTSWTVTSERKFTGKFVVRYYMVSDFEGSEYEGSYVGMAKAYRDYLEGKGTIDLLTDTKTDIPLYIETFGKIEVQDTIMTMPVWVDTPLTSFEDVSTMYKTLSENQNYAITNVNFRLKGYNDGNLDNEVYPTYIKYERVVGGNSGYNKLVKEANEKGFGVFPDFDFANVYSNKLFSGFRYQKWTVRTIDDRYARKREYDAVYQSFQYMGCVLVSPAYYSNVFEKFEKAFGKFEYSGISAGTLGTDLNSDFDRDEPYNREDDKQYTVELLGKLYETYGDNIMVDGGNSYTWKYAKHILNATLDSSRYLRATTSVPFLGMVLHGYIYLAGTPTNMEGNMEYEILKMIENGANPYFTLSYQNTNDLKESYPEYYSVDFRIWLEDLIETYKIINEAMKDVQTSRIKDHKFVVGNRVLTESETKLVQDAHNAALLDYEEYYNAALTKYNNAKIRAQRAAEEEGKVFDEEAYIEEVGEFECLTFEEYYQEEIDTVIDNYTVVLETYENGIRFLLNYNNFDVTVDVDGTVYTVSSMDFVKIPA